MKFFQVVALASGILPTNAFAQPITAVIELFTSQGCSSCPPADKLAAELAQNPNLIVLSFPVDYWDNLGWKDTLAKHVFTERQQAYALERGDKQVYTPQVVVNGMNHAVGSERSDITKLAQSNNPSVALKIIHARDGHILQVPAFKGGSGTVILLPITRSKSVNIGRGENHGHIVTYTNVVRGIIKLGDWKGEATSFNIPPVFGNSDDADSYAVILQSGTIGHPKAIMGAAKAL